MYLIIIFSASALWHCRDAEHISSLLSPLHPISTAYKASRFPASGNAVSSPTTCSTPHYDCDTEARLARIEAAIALLTLGYDSRGQEASRDADQPPNHKASADAVLFTVPIPMQTSLLMPCVPVDGALKTRLASAWRNRRHSTRRLLQTCRRRLDVSNKTLMTATSWWSLQIVLGSRSLQASASAHFWWTPKTSWRCVSARAIAGPSSSFSCSARTKPRKYVVLIVSMTTYYIAFRIGLMTLFKRIEFED